MDGSEILRLVGEVFSGPPENLERHSEEFSRLHSGLLSASEQTLQAVGDQIGRMEQDGLIPELDADRIYEYLDAIAQGETPPIPSLVYVHGPTAHPKAQNATKLVSALLKLGTARSRLVQLCWKDLALNKLNSKVTDDKILHELEVKRLKLSRMTAQFRAALGINLERSVGVWKASKKLEKATEPKKKIKHVRTLSQYEKREKMHDTLAIFINQMPLYFEQGAIWRWRIKQQWLRERQNRFVDACKTYKNLKEKWLRKNSYNIWKELTYAPWEKRQEFLKMCIERADVRCFLTKRICFTAWKTSFFDVEQENGEFVIYPRDDDVHDIIDSISSNTSFKGMDKRSKIDTMRRSRRTDLRNKLDRLITKLTTVSTLKKNMNMNALGYWKLAALGLERDNAEELKRHKGVQKLKTVLEHYPRRYLSRWQTGSRRVESDNYLTSLIRSIMKKHKITVRESFNSWRYKTHEYQTREKEKKMQRLFNPMNRVILAKARTAVKVPIVKDKIRQKLITSMNYHLKHQGFILLRNTMRKWAQFASIPSKDTVLREKHEYAKAFSAVALIHQIFASKTKRVFNPPMIIKDADEIMRRTIKRLLAVKFNLFDTAMLRWKNQFHLSRARLFTSCIIKIVLNRGNERNTMFNRWKTSYKVHKMMKDQMDKDFSLNNIMHHWQRLNMLKLRKAFYRFAFDIRPMRLKLLLALERGARGKVGHAFDLWKSNAEKIRAFNLTADVRRTTLVLKLLHIPARTCRDAVQRIIGQGDKVLGKLRNLENTLKNIPRNALQHWKKWVDLLKQGKLLDSLRARQLQEKLASIPNRTVKDAHQRVIGQGIKVLGTLRALESKLQMIPRNALRDWKDHVDKVKNGEILDNLKARKLLLCLNKIPNRTTKDAVERVVGQGNKILGLLKNLEHRCKQVPRDALRKWKQFAEEAGKRKILDNVRAQKLNNALLRIPQRTVKDAVSRLAGQGDKVKGAISNLFRRYNLLLRDGVARWRDFTNKCKEGKLLDAIRAQKLLQILNNIPARTLRNAVSQFAKPQVNIKALLRSLGKVYLKMPNDAFFLWKRAVISKQNYEAAKDKVNKGKKLNSALTKPTRRAIRSAKHKAKPFDPKKQLKLLAKSFEQRPRDAIHKWKQAVEAINKGVVLDNLRAQKLNNALSHVPQRIMRDAEQRVLGQGEKVLGMLKNLQNQIHKVPRDALRQWKKYADFVNKGKLLDGLRAQKLNSSLAKIPLRSQRDACQRILGQGDKVLATLKTLERKIRQMPKDAFDKWKKYVEHIKIGALLDNVRAQKLIQALGHVPQRIMKDAEQRLLGQGDKILGMLKNLQNQIHKVPRDALRQWKKYADFVNKGKLLDGLRAQKLNSSLAKIPLRSLRDACQRILGQGDKVLATLKALETKIRQMPKDALDKWKKYVEHIKSGAVLDNLRAQKLTQCLSRIPNRIMKDSHQRIMGQGDKILGMLKNLQNQIHKIPRDALRQWKKYADFVNMGKLLDGLKAQKLNASLSKIPLRALKDACQRIIGQGDKVLATLKALENQIKQMPKDALDKWKKFVEHAKIGAVLDNVRAQKLNQCLSKIPMRVTKDAAERIKGQGNKILGLLKSLENKVKSLPRDALRQWKKYADNIRTGALLDNLKAQKLNQTLSRIPARVLRDATERISGQGNKILGVLKNLENKMRNMPRDALHLWKKYADKVNRGLILDGLRAQKLKSTLGTIPLRTLKDACNRIHGDGNLVLGTLKNMENKCKNVLRQAMQKWKEYANKCKQNLILDLVRAQKLNNSLSRIPSRTLKDSIRRIVGEGDLFKGALSNLFRRYKLLLRDGFSKWKDSTSEMKRGEVLNAVKALKLRSHLERIPQRSLRDHFNKIVPATERVKHLFSKIIDMSRKKPKEALEVWRDYVGKVKEGKLIDAIKAQKLKNHLDAVSKRSLRVPFSSIIRSNRPVRSALRDLANIYLKLPSDAFSLWKRGTDSKKNKEEFKGKTEKANKMKNALSKPTRRAIRSAKKHTKPEKATDKIKLLIRAFEKRPREALQRWKEAVEAMKKGQILDNMRALQLQNKMNGIPARTLQDACKRIVGQGDIVLGVLKNLENKIKRRPREALQQWVKFRDNINTGKIIDNLRAQKLSSALSKVPIRVLRDAQQRLMGQGDRILAVLRNMEKGIKNRPRDALSLWKKYAEQVAMGALLDNIRAQKLKQALAQIPNRTLKDAYERVLGQGNKVLAMLKQMDSKLRKLPRDALSQWKKYNDEVKKGALLDRVRAQQLSRVLNNIPLRTAKDAHSRLIGQGNKILGTLKNLENRLRHMPRDALQKWRKYVNDINAGAILDRLRAEKLRIALTSIPMRVLKDAENRIVGQGNLVLGVLKNLEGKLRQLPRDALQQWKKYADEVKKGALLDSLRAEKLKFTLNQIPQRVLKDSVERVIGQGNKVIGVLKNLEHKFRQLPRDALRHWKNLVEHIKKGLLIDGLRAQKLNSTLSRIPVRTLKDACNRIQGNGDLVLGALKNLENKCRNLIRQALRKWKDYVVRCKENMILDMVRVQQLKNALTRIPSRVLRDTVERVIGQGDKVRGAIANLFRRYNLLLRDGFGKWKDEMQAMKRGEILNAVRALKLRQHLERIPQRSLREYYNKIVPATDRIKHLLSRLFESIKRKPREALDIWKDYVQKCREGVLIDQIRAQKLKTHLHNMSKRSLRVPFATILQSSLPVKAALRSLARTYLKMPSDAFYLWKKGVAEHKNTENVKQRLNKANKMKNSLSKPTRRAIRSARHQTSPTNVQKQLKLLAKFFEQRPRDAINKWKEYLNSVKEGQLLDNIRAQKLNAHMSKIPARTMKDAVNRLVGQGDLVLGMLKALENKLKQVPRDALKNWKDFNERAKLGLIMDNLRAQKLNKTLSSIPNRVLKDACTRIVGQGDKILGILRGLETALRKRPREALQLWKNFVKAVNDKQMLNQLQAQSLKSHLFKLCTRSLKDAYSRIIGQGDLVSGALRRLHMSYLKKQRQAYDLWRQYVHDANIIGLHDRIKAQKLRHALSTIPQRTIKDTYQRVLGQGDKVKGALRRLNATLMKILPDAFNLWKSYANTVNSKEMLDNFRSQKLLISMNKICARTTRQTYLRIVGMEELIKSRLRNLHKHQMINQLLTFKALEARKEKFRLINKVKGSYILLELIAGSLKAMMKGRFNIWRFSEGIKKKRLMMKSIMIIIDKVQLFQNPQISFWRWKYTTTNTGTHLNPNHSIMYKKLGHIATNYKRRLLQFAFFRLILDFRYRNSGKANFAPKKMESNERIESPKDTKLSNDEINRINQMGGAEVIGLTIKHARLRQLGICHSALATYAQHVGMFDDEKARLIEQINELRLDKHNLLEDNTALRSHNEALIDNLERTNLNFQNLSMHLDQMRLGRMVRVISKMIDMPVLEAFLLLRHNTGFFTPVNF